LANQTTSLALCPTRKNNTAFHSPPDIPSELRDRIVDYLHDDVKAFSPDALTCKQPLPRAQYDRSQIAVLDAVSRRTCYRFLDRTPVIVNFIRNLAMHANKCRAKKPIHASKLASDTLATLLERLFSVW
jgi:hypothetical protein